MLSTARLSRRFDNQAFDFKPVISKSLVDPIRDIDAPVTFLDTGHVPLDINVFTLDNSNTKKEGVSRTYQGFDGYAPIAAYLGQEGWCVGIDTQKGESTQVSFIVKWNRKREDVQEWKEKAFKGGRVAKPRVGKKVAYLTVRRRRVHNGKTHFFTLVIRVIERTIASNGQMMLSPDVELEGWWTSLELSEEHIIGGYEDHAVCEQHHSEFKSDKMKLN